MILACIHMISELCYAKNRFIKLIRDASMHTRVTVCLSEIYNANA